MKTIRVALIGYGSAASIFHAPLISGVPALQLATICSTKPQVVLAQWPQVNVVATAQMAFADPSIDLVAIATGNESHYPLAKEALLAGKHVVVDKPCTVTLEQTQDLLDTAARVQRVLTVFQNRRWDADFLTLQQVLAGGVLGRIVHFESHFDRYRPVVPKRWREQDLPGSGLWFDLGPHLVDQCLQLFGEPQDIMLDLAHQRDGAQVNDYFHAQLRYGARNPGLRVLLHASTLVPAVGPRFVVHGTLGSWVKYGMDVQEDALKVGARPRWALESDWGKDPQAGQLTVPQDDGPVVSATLGVPGNYLAFYSQLADYLNAIASVSAHAPAITPPVTPVQLELAMRVLERGQESAAQQRWVTVPLEDSLDMALPSVNPYTARSPLKHPEP